MKNVFLAVVFVLGMAFNANACDIFSSNVVSVVPSNVVVNVPAHVRTHNVAFATPVAAPVVLQQSSPFVSGYSISSVQPVIGVNSLVPTAVRFRSFGHVGFSRGVAVNAFGNKVLLNSFGNQAFISNVHGFNAVNVFNANRVRVRRGLFGSTVVRAR